MDTRPFPIQRFLVPDLKPRAPEGFLAIDEKPLGGFPHTIQLDRDTSLVVVIPTGLAQTWRDLDPTTVVTRSEEELTPAPPHNTEPIGSVARVPIRLLMRRAAVTVAWVPLAAGLRRVLPDSGETGRGVRIELVILAWDIRAGTLRGPGDFESRITLAWRRADEAIVSYSTPPVNPQLVPRLKPENRMESDVGRRITVKLQRFEIKKVLRPEIKLLFVP